MIKKYRTTDQLIKILKRKGVIINDENNARLLLEKYSYYSIINTYKNVFKKRKKYVDNVSFEEIYALYEFDKKLKYLVLESVLEVELIIKTNIANLIGEKYGIKNYLVVQNFENDKDKKTSNEVKQLINRIKSDIEKYKGENKAFYHYKNKYGFIPPWVLVKILSLGIINKLYSIMKQSDRQMISKIYKTDDNNLDKILTVVRLVRNICAHNDRLFDFRTKYKIKVDNESKIYINNLYMVIEAMRIILGNDIIEKLICNIKYEMELLNGKIHSIDINDINNIIGI